MEGKNFESAGDTGTTTTSPVDYISLMSNGKDQARSSKIDVAEAPKPAEADKTRDDAKEKEPQVRFEGDKFKEAMEQAHKMGRDMVLEAGASWCGPCKQMDTETWGVPGDAKKPGDPKVAGELKKNYVFTKVDVDANPEIAQQYGISSVPTTLIGKVTRNDQGELKFEPSKRLTGYHRPSDILRAITKPETRK